MFACILRIFSGLEIFLQDIFSRCTLSLGFGSTFKRDLTLLIGHTEDARYF
jgi:hypothetical protein